MQKFLDESTEGTGLACVILENDAEILKEVRGIESIESEMPVAPNTIFRLASVSKQFIAASILILEQDDALSLDDSILKFFPDFPEYGHGINVRHLLTHSSGLIDYEDLLPKDYTGHISDEEVLILLQQQKKGYFIPGEKYRYNNGGFCLLHLILERVAGQSLELFLEEHIFDPLGMHDALVHTSGVPDIANMAIGHSYIGGEYKLHNQDATSWTIGDGGIYASINDLAAWAQVYQTHRVGTYDLSALFQRHTEIEESNRWYGYGVALLQTKDGPVVYHEGETVGFRTCIYYLQEKNLYVTATFNRDNVDPFSVCEKLASLVTSS